MQKAVLLLLLEERSSSAGLASSAADTLKKLNSTSRQSRAAAGAKPAPAGCVPASGGKVTHRSQPSVQQQHRAGDVWGSGLRAERHRELRACSGAACTAPRAWGRPWESLTQRKLLREKRSAERSAELPAAVPATLSPPMPRRARAARTSCAGSAGCSG